MLAAYLAAVGVGENVIFQGVKHQVAKLGLGLVQAPEPVALVEVVVEFGEDLWSVRDYCFQHQMQDVQSDYLPTLEASQVEEEVEEVH